jgi:hypothetical protein
LPNLGLIPSLYACAEIRFAFTDEDEGGDILKHHLLAGISLACSKNAY